MKKRDGSANVFFLLFFILFILITTITVEFYHIFTVKEHVETELSRAVNIAVDTAMLDEYRMEHISMIHIPTAQSAFESYLHNEMQLDSANERKQDGKVLYRMILHKTVLENNPVVFEVSGVVITKPVLLSDFVPMEIEIPFKVKARNQRYE